MTLAFYNDPATDEISTLSLHDALPICEDLLEQLIGHLRVGDRDLAEERFDGRIVLQFRFELLVRLRVDPADEEAGHRREDRKSTRLNSSHSQISYAVFCLKKKKQTISG